MGDDGFMASSGIVSTIGDDTPNGVVFRDLSQKSRQNRGITDLVARDLDTPDFQ